MEQIVTYNYLDVRDSKSSDSLVFADIFEHKETFSTFIWAGYFEKETLINHWLTQLLV